jgi:hypothetical protein
LGKIAENCDHNIDPWSPCLEGRKIEFFGADGFNTSFVKNQGLLQKSVYYSKIE